MIKESVIEASNQSQVKSILDNGINEDLNNQVYDKSLSLDMNSQKDSQNNQIL